VVASSAHPTGVFERASVRITGGASKKWVVRLTGRNVLVPPQHVYWTAVARP